MRIKIPGIAFVLPLLLLSCGNSEKDAESNLINFITRHESTMIPLSEQINRTFWNYARTGANVYMTRYDSLNQVKMEFLHDKRKFSYLKRLRESGRIKDAYLQRQLEILYRQYLPCQADLSLQVRIGRLQNHLKHEVWKKEKRMRARPIKDSDGYDARREASLADSLLLLVDLRNELARQAGFSDYYALQFFLDEMDPAYVDELFARLEERTDSVFRQLRNEEYFPDYTGSFAPYGQRPQDERRDACYGEVDMPHLALRFFSGIGLELEEVVAHSDFSRCYAKLPLFRCVTMDRKNDIRMVGILDGKETDMLKLLACCGEAAYWKSIPNTLPYLLRCPSSFMLQMGVASFFSRMVGYPDWSLSMGIFSAGQAGRLRGTTSREFVREQLFFCRWSLLVYHFERRLYADRKTDLAGLWRELNRRYLFVDLDSDSEHAASRKRREWMADTYFFVEACRIHDFLLAELWAAQVTEHLCTTYPKLGDPCSPFLVGSGEIGGDFRKSVFEPGAGLRWDDLTRLATGKDLGLESFVEQFCQARK